MEPIANKTLFGLIAGVGGYLFQCINEIIIILALLMIVDYIVGVTLALRKKKWTKDKGIDGLVKKIGYMVCVLLGFLLDYIILWLAQNTGFNFNTGGFFGIAVSCYLVGTEGLSISKNLHLLGVPVPAFLVKSFEQIQEISQKQDN